MPAIRRVSALLCLLASLPPGLECRRPPPGRAHRLATSSSPRRKRSPPAWPATPIIPLRSTRLVTANSRQPVTAEATTWPDNIRNDTGFDDPRDPPTPPLPGLPDTSRHKRWHYIDLDSDGRVREGELERDRALDMRAADTSRQPEQVLPCPGCCIWSSDIRRPLHVGRHGDEGGNAVVENPFNKRLPFPACTCTGTTCRPTLAARQAAEDNARRLLERYPAPAQGNVALWREKAAVSSRARLTPARRAACCPVVDEAFHRNSRDTANLAHRRKPATASATCSSAFRPRRFTWNEIESRHERTAPDRRPA